MQRLFTEEGMTLPEIPWNRYPRPMLRREKWLCLNGDWDFRAEGLPKRKIRVPFCPESLLSGIQTPPEPGTRMVYERDFAVPEDWAGSRILLHFGAVSRSCRVSVNGTEVCRHEQAYLPFEADITDSLKPGVNRLRAEAVNDLSARYPWGKQSRKRGGMWYTPVSGIWQTVWLEPVPEKRIRALHVEADDRGAVIRAEADGEVTFLLDGKPLPLENGEARFRPEKPELWSPDHPKLYDFEAVCGEDRVRSYFALRRLSTETADGVRRLCLNGKPFFFNGLLDQGYWSDGLYTPAGPEAFEKDILAMKSLGYNTLRKHIKIEPEQFYYDCDRLGMAVFQDMVNSGEYRYLRDTVLPTFGVTRLSDRGRNRDAETRRLFLESMEETVRLLRGHPCICLWTIFNEGWGQFCADDAFRRLKQLDGSRFVDSTSGWFHQELSDVESLHIYFRKLHPAEGDRPQLLSEFGGYSYKLPEHSFNLEKTYGYRKFEDREEYVRALRALYEELAALAAKGLSGAVYTQVSDVEDETNGLFTFDRRVLKVSPEEMRPMMEKLK